MNEAQKIPKEKLLDTVLDLKRSGFEVLHCLTAVDKKENIELVYIFQSLQKNEMICLKVALMPGDLRIESISSLYQAADWNEREVFDLFGVKFLNHPNLTRILNPDDWQGHPLRKDYTYPDAG